jgi:hypothetical protein
MLRIFAEAIGFLLGLAGLLALVLLAYAALYLI